ncbi:hypothetical protein [Lysobacter sp. Root604]|uniref:hypothetical protein n=1 Tax=Lysobacter sp. Root604 TaxID=1736568 RepID=UPI0006F2B540|nr:hypothetical protein [Lysobacter sp. Root604]KRA17071.1 hypothetical protein ASD69_10080 [Lysobacter sp. Root604]
MKLTVLSLATALALAASPAFATPPQAAALSIDCARPALPDQQAVARLTGIDNLGQAYAVRARLMADVGRACRRAGAQRVRIVLAEQAGDARRLAAVR